MNNLAILFDILYILCWFCLSLGVSTAVAPLYLSEISPTSLRGATGTINQFAIVVGILLSNVLGLQQLLGTTNKIPFLLGKLM